MVVRDPAARVGIKHVVDEELPLLHQAEVILRAAGFAPFQQIMHGPIGGQKGQAVGQLKALMAQRAVGAEGGAAEGCFVNQMQSQARGQGVIGQLAGPGAQQIPGAEAKMFGDQQPHSQEIARNSISQKLADLTFHAGGVGLLEALSFAGALGGQQRGWVFGVEGVEFFFEGRNRR